MTRRKFYGKSWLSKDLGEGKHFSVIFLCSVLRKRGFCFGTMSVIVGPNLNILECVFVYMGNIYISLVFVHCGITIFCRALHFVTFSCNRFVLSSDLLCLCMVMGI